MLETVKAWYIHDIIMWQMSRTAMDDPSMSAEFLVTVMRIG